MTTGLLLLKAILVGFAVSAPPGPVGAVCIGRTLRRGPAAGMWSGLGAALGDTLYALVVLVGLATSADLVREGRAWLALVAAPILLFAGVRVLLRARRTEDVADRTEGSAPGPAGLMGSAAFLTLGAPGTLPAFLALFATFDVPGTTHPPLSGVVLACAGVAVGGMLWWTLLCGVAHACRARAVQGLRLVDHASGALLLLAGAAALCLALESLPVAL